MHGWDKQNLWVRLYVVPNSKQDEVIDTYQNAYKIKIRAPARENQANHSMIKLLSQWFDVPKAQVILIQGQKSRLKQFKIIAPKSLPTWLNGNYEHQTKRN